MNDGIVHNEYDGRSFRRKLIWLVMIKVAALTLIGLYIAFYLV